MSDLNNDSTKDDSTSEVGCNPMPTEMQQMFRHFFAEQNNSFIEMMRTIREPAKPLRQNVVLPIFNSNLKDSDAVSWCKMVDLIFNEKPLEGSALMTALSGALTGGAAQWLTQVCFPGISWAQFKEAFLHRFDNAETLAASVMNLLNGRPQNGESVAAYGNRIANMLESKWKNKTVEEIAVSVVLSHLPSVDKRIQRLTYTTDIKTKVDLQHELQAYSYNEKLESTEGGPMKKMKLTTLIQCHFCGRNGHKMAECHFRKEQQKDKRHPTAPSSSLPAQKKAVICFKCGVAGHIASVCPKAGSSGISEKNINMCEKLIDPKGLMLHSGKSLQFYFDSGAECSLVKETTAGKFNGKRFNNLVFLKGIGNATVQSNLQILALVCINDFSLEILFHVVMDEFLKYNIIVGREILSMGFGVVTTPTSFSVFRIKEINTCSMQLIDTNLQKVSPELSESDKTQLLSILENYVEGFTCGIPRKQVKTGQLEIRLIDNNKIVQRRPYRMSPEERQIVRAKVQELIEANIVRASCSPFASPILLVKKKNGTDRLCVDYRELNSNTVSDKYPLPLISDQIARMRGAKYFSSLDMASGFYQIPVHPKSVERTAFVTPDGQFEFLTMPFGLKNAPSVFQRAIMKALGDIAYSYAIVYMDDIMIVASTKEEAFQRLNVVLDTLTKAGFSLNLEKCAFLKTKIEYLGYEVQSGEVRPNPRKILALTELPPPKTISQLRQFIGLASYFRQFVPKFSQVMKPLYLLTSGKNLVWQTDHEKVRAEIITILTSHPVLVIFDPQYEIELHTDASAEGYGAILLHRIQNKPHPIEYFSKTTNKAERNYHSYELETLAVVNSIKHFRHYLQGRQFTLFTDCNSLKSSQKKKELTPRAQRWWAYLQNFNFEIQYREGKRMAHVDFLSRNPISILNHTKIEQKQIDLTEISRDWLLAEQANDPEISSIITKIQNQELSEDMYNTYELRQGILCRKIQRYGKTRCLSMVPRAFRWSIVNHFHDSVMHLGWVKTLDKIYNYYWFDKMSKYVRKFVDNCITCKLSKSASGKPQIELHSIPKVDIPWHTIHIDITGKLSGKSDKKEYIIVQIDGFTKFVFLHHTLNVDAESCIKAVKSSISLLGVPSRIIADQGRCFTGKNFSSFCASQNIDLHLIATGASRANGQVERVMSTLKNLLTVIESSQRSWQDALGEIQLVLNSTTNRVTKLSPLELLIGKEVRPFGLMAPDEDECTKERFSERKLAVSRMSASAQYDKSRFDRNKAKIKKHNIGDYVLLKNEERHQTKLDAKYRGPFKVINVLDGDRYEIRSLSNNRVYKYPHEALRKLPECVPRDEDFLYDDNEKEKGRDENLAKESIVKETSNEML